jgi:hypothetical protein
VRALTANEVQILIDIRDPIAAHYRGGHTWAEHYRRVPVLHELASQKRVALSDRGGYQITELGRLALRLATLHPEVLL